MAFMFFIRSQSAIPPSSDWPNWSGNSGFVTTPVASNMQLDVERDRPTNNTVWATWSGNSAFTPIAVANSMIEIQ